MLACVFWNIPLQAHIPAVVLLRALDGDVIDGGGLDDAVGDAGEETSGSEWSSFLLLAVC